METEPLQIRKSSLQRSLLLLIESLEAKRDEGNLTVWLTPKARKDLHALPGLDWGAVPAEYSEQGSCEACPPPQRSIPDRELEGAGMAMAVPSLRVREETAGVEDQMFQPPGETRHEKLAWLRERAANWAPARKLNSLRDTMVFAVGNPDADLMLVGEAPGAEEERRGEPFVGPAGETLTKILKAMGLKRDEVYITNIVKFRPAMTEQGQSNRPPTPEEMASCVAFVRAEIGIVRPKVIVALGGTASKGLLGRDDPVARLRGRFLEYQGIPVMVTYHPAYLLHQKSGHAEKRKVWEDMLLVMERLGLPISEKQRAFFT